MRRIKSFIKRLSGIALLVFLIYLLSLGKNLFNIGPSVLGDGFTGLKNSISGEKINSESALLLELDGGEVLFEKNKDKKLYPASLTKIMTTIVALENIDSLDDRVLLVEDDYKNVYEEGLATAGFKIGDSVTNRDLLYGIILPSGAEAVNAMTRNLGGKDYFVRKMNEKAKEIGMNNTNFVNATGMQDDQHYTTANDLALLVEYALENGHFRAIISRESYVTEITGLRMTSRVFDRLEESRLENGIIEGGKTGYTEKAGLCLATVYKEEGKEYILISLGAEGEANGIQYNFLDAYNIYNNYIS